MKIIAVVLAAMLCLVVPQSGNAQGTIKIGLILEYSGQFADAAVQIDNGIKFYMQQHGDMVAGKKVEIIRRDTGGLAPDVAKRLAQELVIRDKVDVLAGFATTPNAFAAADVSAEAKKFMVIMNAATSIITTKSPYVVRTSYTLPQVTEPLGTWAYKAGARRGYTLVPDFGPGLDAEAAYQRTFKEAGGEIVGSVRYPVMNPDFSAYVQRAKDVGPDVIFVFVPGGAQPPALAKSLADRGIDLSKTKIVGTDVMTDDAALKSMGNAGIGIITGANYDHNLRTPLNPEFVQKFRKSFSRNPDLFAVGGYDGMRLIYEAIKKTSGQTDGEKLVDAAKGMKWESPRGPMMIDPQTRDVVQTIYIRRVEKVDGNLVNVEFEKFENVKDPVKARMKN